MFQAFPPQTVQNLAEGGKGFPQDEHVDLPPETGLGLTAPVVEGVFGEVLTEPCALIMSLWRALSKVLIGGAGGGGGRLLEEL